MRRCAWADTGDDLLRRYHDTEWGVPVHDDRRHFEFLTLEGAQAGLSWATILKKRPGYAKAFADFDPVRVARFSPARLHALGSDPRIVRNRRKIASVVQNARAFLAVQREFGSFDEYIWRIGEGSAPHVPPKKAATIPPGTPGSERVSRDLKRRGFGFVGSTTIYAYMQAVGLVNDHVVGCFRRRPVEAARSRPWGRARRGPLA